MALRRLLLLSVLVIAGMAAVLATVGAWDRVRSRPLDITQVRQRLGIHAPEPIVQFVKRDGVSFQAHALMATLIERTHGDPAAAGVQWVKAGAHARSEAELDQVAAGLKQVKEHSDDLPTLTGTLCAYVEGGYWSGRQREAFSAADIPCTRSSRRS